SVRFFVSDAIGEHGERVVGSAVRPYDVLPNLLDSEFEKLELNGSRDPNRPFRFLNVAELNANKRHVDLLHAFARVVRTSPCELRIVGHGPLARKLASLSRQLGIAE